MRPTIHELTSHTDNHMSFRETGLERQKVIDDTSKAFRAKVKADRERLGLSEDSFEMARRDV